MKKIFWSLAALMMMTAPVMTSCSSEALDEVAPVEEVKENVVTLTIKMPEQAETRVGVDDTTLKLTGWEENDVVKVYNFDYPNLSEGVAFKCTNPSEGTFTGTLPKGKTLSDYNFAIYGHDIELVDNGYYVGFFDNMISRNLKDVVLLAGEISGKTCTMSIHNNVIKVINNGGSVTVAWHDGSSHFVELLYKACNMHPNNIIIPASTGECGHGNRLIEVTTFAEADPITIPIGTSYIFMPATDEAVGLYTEGGDPVVPAKAHADNHHGFVGKLYKVTITGPTTGTAKATIGGSTVNVNWVQLWAGGPMFAEYNVGVTDGKAESYGGYYCWGSSINIDKKWAYKDGTADLTGTDDTATNLWGSAWRMPTKEELDGLLANCDKGWTSVNGMNGRKFTGKGDYASNSVFLPSAGWCVWGKVMDQGDYVSYWSSTHDGSDSAYKLGSDSSNNNEAVHLSGREYGGSVRAVLAE